MRVHRAFRAASVVAAAMVILAILAACGGTDSTGGSTGSASDTLRVGSPAAPSTLDPATFLAGGDRLWLKLLYDPLINLDPKTYAPVDGGLAKSWSWSDDKKTLHVKLHPGVKFQDGTPLDAVAVKTSIDRFQSKVVYKQYLLPTLASVSPVADLDVDFVLNAPDPYLPQRLGDVAGMIVSPKALQATPNDVTKNPVGAGPYKLTNYVEGSSLTLTQDDGYWGTKPAYRTMQFTLFTNTVSMVQAFQASQLDFIVRVPFADQKTLAGNANFTAVTSPSVWEMVLRTASLDPNSPLHDVRVRRAIDLGLDREKINELATEGAGVPVNQLVPPESPYYDKDVASANAHNVDEAKKLVAEVYPNGVNLKCATYTGSTLEPAVPEVIAQLKAIGINADLQVAPLSNIVSKANSGEIPCYFSLYIGDVSPDVTMDGLYGAKSSTGVVTDPAQLPDQNLITAIRTAEGTQAQVTAVQALLKAAQQSEIGIPLYTRPTAVTMTKTVTGYVPDQAYWSLRTLKPAS